MGKNLRVKGPGKSGMNTLWAVLALLMLLCGCSEDSPVNPPAIPTTTEEPAITAPATDLAAVLADYQRTYDADHVFTDCFVKEKFLLVSDTQVVEVLYVPGAAQVKTMARDSVQRLEQTALADFSTVKIYDKTGTPLTVSLTAADGAALTALLG